MYQHYTNARGHTVLHGSYQTYSERAQNLLWSERTFFNGQAIALRYERCGPTEDPPIANGDFELGDYTAWRLEGARSTSIQLVPSNDPQRGLHSAKLTLHPVDIVRVDSGRCRLIYHDAEQVQHEIGAFPIRKGAWSSVFFQIRWSMNGGGYIEMHADEQPVTAFNGTDYKSYRSNTYNETGNYLKIGLYRDKQAEAINSVYVDNTYIEACP